jgi:Flp pilus assembly protein TadG
MEIRSKARGEEGAAAVEFALIVGLLAILIFGLLEYGLAFWQVQNLRAAAREGARVAAVGGDDTAVRTAMQQSSAGSFTGGATFGRNRTCDQTDATRGLPVTITIDNASLPSSVQQAFTVSIPFLPPITLNPTLSGTFRCE